MIKRTLDCRNAAEVIVSGFEKWDAVQNVALSGTCYEVYREIEDRYAGDNGLINFADLQDAICGAFQVGYGQGMQDGEEDY